MIWELHNAMDQGHQSSFIWSPGGSSFFSEELRFPNEQQVGFSKAESMKDEFGTEGISLSQNKAVALSPDKQFHLPGSNYQNGLLLNSLPDFLKEKPTLSSNNVQLGESMGTCSNFGQDEPFQSMEEIEAQTIGNLLPDDDDLLSGVLDNIGYTYQLNGGDDIDDDIFYSGGGIELETDESNNANRIPGFVGEGISNSHQGGLNSTLAGEHPFGEHPSRTLFVRNINSNVEDAELKILFEQYGDIRALYTACKHRGFVMISYYDIRSARNAMRALQNKPLRRRKLDIHYSIPKENPSDKDINQGTLVVFNLDPSVPNDELLQIFGVYGEIKEIRETPHKHHKFIEFYDTRAAEAALALDRSDIAGKKIKLEPSRSGGARRTIIQQLSPEVTQDELNGGNPSSPNSQTGYFGSVPLGPDTSNDGAASSFQYANRATVSSLMDTTIEGISSSVSQNLSSPIRISPVLHHGNHSVSDDLSHLLAQINLGYQAMSSFHPNSLPDYYNGPTDRTSYNTSTMSGLGLNIIRPAEAVDSRHRRTLSSTSLNSSAFDDNGGAFDLSGRHQYSWNNINAFQHQVPSSIPWSNSPSFMNNITTHQNGLPRQSPHMRNNSLSLHHVGSAPTANRTLWDRRHAYPGDSTEFHSGSLESMGFPGNQLHHLELAPQNIFSRGCGSCCDHSISPAHGGIPSPQQRCQLFHGRNRMGHSPGSFESPTDRIRSRRNDASPNQSDNKKQYELDIDRIGNGEDSRTTLMIKNIPNKYSAEMLLQAIDENHQKTYDFIYLPIDFKNNCNVGYAFINMTSPQHIVPFYQTFNGKKWEKFNSEKVASLAYARIQGKSALVAHFRNSSLMNEDKRCRPILFFSDGPNAGEREPFPTGPNVRSRPGRSRTANGSEEQHLESPSTTTPDLHASYDALASPLGSSVDLE